MLTRGSTTRLIKAKAKPLTKCLRCVGKVLEPLQDAAEMFKLSGDSTSASECLYLTAQILHTLGRVEERNAAAEAWAEIKGGLPIGVVA